jgi:predicted phage gp36 major capsid-like protein
VRYEEVNEMLLNEFLKEHRKVQDLKATVAQLKAAAAKQEAVNAEQQKGMESVNARLKKQELQIQKVSAQLEARKPSPQMVLNNQ